MKYVMVNYHTLNDFNAGLPLLTLFETITILCCSLMFMHSCSKEEFHSSGPYPLHLTNKHSGLLNVIFAILNL